MKINGFKIILFLLAALAGWILLAPLVAKFLIVEKPLENAEAIYVLSGSSVYVERTQKAAELYRQKIAPRIILSDDGERGGWSRIEKRNPRFAEIARDELIRQGVDEKNIEILQPPISATIDEARLLTDAAKQENLQRILLVTSAYHTRRTISTFEKVAAAGNAPIIFGIAAVSPGIQTPLPAVWWLKTLGWKWVASEYVKLLFYSLYY